MPTPPPLPHQPAPPQKKGGCFRAFLIAAGLVFAVIVLAGIIGTLLRPTSESTSPTAVASSSTAAVPAMMPEGRTISWREVDSIYNLRSKNTDLQKNEEWKRFKGRRVTWSGAVSSISDGWTGLTLQVKMNPDTFTSDLLIRLKKTEKSKALRLHQGDRVTFTGTLRDWGTLMPITLDDGEILE